MLGWRLKKKILQSTHIALVIIGGGAQSRNIPPPIAFLGPIIGILLVQIWCFSRLFLVPGAQMDVGMAEHALEKRFY